MSRRSAADRCRLHLLCLSLCSLAPCSVGGIFGDCPWDNTKLLSARTYCHYFNKVCAHCLVVLHTETDLYLALELYGGEIDEAVVRCNAHKGDPVEAAMKSHLFQFGKHQGYKIKERLPAKLVSGVDHKGNEWNPYIGKYKRADWSDQEEVTFDADWYGVQGWVEDYLDEFPDYGALTTNCQKFSVGLYNAITHSKKKEYQYKAVAVARTAGRAVHGSLKGSGS